MGLLGAGGAHADSGEAAVGGIPLCRLPHSQGLPARHATALPAFAAARQNSLHGNLKNEACRSDSGNFCCAGQAIAINMPLTVDAVIAYFGIVLAGCAVVSIADSFAAGEIASRLRIAKAVAIVTQASCSVASVVSEVSAL